MLVPGAYGAIAYAVLLDGLIWGTVPGFWEGMGTLVLVASGLPAWWRDVR